MKRRNAQPSTGRIRGWFVVDQPEFRARGSWLLLAFAAMAVTLFGRLVQVQLRDGSALAAAATAQHLEQITVHGHRGEILDSSGRVLVSNRTVYDVYADPGLITADQRSGVATQLAPILSMGPSKLDDLLNEPTRFIYLAKGVDEAVETRLTALDLPGIVVQPRDVRVEEPSPVSGDSFAANLLGYVDHDGSGQYGVEAYYNSILGGQDGHESTVRDLAGNSIVLSHQQPNDAVDGRNLQLGLDSEVQYWSEQAIAKGVADAQAQSGTLMVMDTKTGALRAWAQYPSYDANQYWSAPVGDFRDLGVADLYEPGSVQKLVTFGGGLNQKVIWPGYTIDEGPQTIDGWTIHDWDNRAHGNVSMQTVLDQSLNNGALEIGRLLGRQAFYANLQSFGMGSPTGIDLAGEQAKPLAPLDQWSDLDLAEAAFGQHLQVTPVEMLAAVNAIANGGVWVQPHAVQATIDPATGASTPYVPQTRRVISADAAATLAQMMTGGVEDRGAEGFNARIPGFKGEVAGKTGTASVAINGQYGQEVITSFAGFLPAKNPRFTMMVVLRYPHETKVPRFGSLLAAPVWKSIAQVMIDQWRILP